MTGSSPWSRGASLLIVVVFLVIVAFDLGESHDTGPTNYESSVSEIEPSSAGVSFEVAGGDAFLVVEADSAHQVLVPGYFGEPYVRIDPNGFVFVNENSPAFSINQDRYGQVGAPDAVADEDEPRWVRVGTGGAYAWLDHRTHWMSSDLPPAVTGDQRERVFPWNVPVEIDGHLATVSGELVWEPSRSAIPALLAGMIVLVPLVLVRRRQSLWLAIVVFVAALVALAVTVAQISALPSSVRSIPVELFYPILALGVGVWALASATTHRSHSDWLSLGASLILIPWVAGSLPVLWLPILSSKIPAALERALVALVAWAVVAVIVVCAVRVVAPLVRERGTQPSVELRTPPIA